tara:strand:- start:300 stop:527 length:228 start_codon:yes stop_codon:yes gene_type:complete
MESWYVELTFIMKMKNLIHGLLISMFTCLFFPKTTGFRFSREQALRIATHGMLIVVLIFMALFAFLAVKIHNQLT